MKDKWPKMLPEKSHKTDTHPIKCPTCGELTSIYHEEFLTFKTMVGYSGHDGNCITGITKCVNGHIFKGTTHRFCLECDWDGHRICSISGHDQIVALTEDSPEVIEQRRLMALIEQQRKAIDHE